MRRVAPLLAALLLGVAAPAKPRRIMSLDMCDDIRLLMLVPRDRIASVTYLAHPAAVALLPAGADAGIPINHGTAEEIAREKPDLIIGAPFSAGTAQRLARMVGARVLELPIAESFADIRSNLRRMGAAVGEPARAALLIRRMDAVLARLAASRPARPRRVVAWSAGEAVSGEGTLTDAVITAAGADNVAARYAGPSYSSFDLEQLLAARPDAVMRATALDAAPSLHRGEAWHPLIDRYFAGRQIDYPAAATECGLPQTALTALALRRALERLPAGRVRW